jgi:hypothetical protein
MYTSWARKKQALHHNSRGSTTTLPLCCELRVFTRYSDRTRKQQKINKNKKTEREKKGKRQQLYYS